MASLQAMREAVQRVATAPFIRGVIFDLDGTLLDSEALYRRAFLDALATFGQSVDIEAYAELIGLATPDRMALLTGRFGPEFPFEAFTAEYYRQKRRHLANGVSLKPGALELLAWLDAHDIPAALATAASHSTAEGALKQVGLLRRFRVLATRDHVARRKPHPDLFLRAAQLLRAEPCDCLILEDSAPGIQAAHAAGAIPILIPDLGFIPAHIRQKSFAVAPDLHAVRAMLAGD